MPRPAPPLPLPLSARLDALLAEARADYGPLGADWYDGGRADGGADGDDGGQALGLPQAASALEAAGVFAVLILGLALSGGLCYLAVLGASALLHALL